MSSKAKWLSEQELKVYYPKVHQTFFSTKGYDKFRQIGMKLKEKHKSIDRP